MKIASRHRSRVPMPFPPFGGEIGAAYDDSLSEWPASEHVIRIDVDGAVWIKPDAAIAYRGDIKFEHAVTSKEGSKETAAHALSPFTHASGSGILYCAHKGRQLRVLEMAGGTILVTSESLLAFEETLRLEIVPADHGTGTAAGGLFAMKLSGYGKLAFAVHGDSPLMKVVSGETVFADAH